MQKTNLQLAPYFDDFDSSKNYQKILFKPGYPVQARELTQLQTQLQNQIEKFGNHTFKDGSVVIPGQIGYDLQYDAVLVQNLIGGVEVEATRTSLVGKTLKGSTTGVEAEVVNTISVTTSEKNAITLYVKYTKSGSSTAGIQSTKFGNNETLIDTSTNLNVAQTYLLNATEYTGSIAYITNGIYYIRGFFVEVIDQNIILNQYSNKPTYKIGLTVTEEKITSDEDSTLFDNANGYSNFAAPGADRLKITASLSKELTSFSDNGNFIELLRLKDGILERIVETSLYSELEKNLARRTYDESGDYTVRDFTVKVKEALDNGDNGGIYNPNEVLADGRSILARDPLETDPTNSFNGNNYYALEVSSGKAYVRGFEIDNVAKKYVLAEKTRVTSASNNKTTNTSFGSYFTISSAVQTVTAGQTLSLRNSSNAVIGNARAVGVVPASTGHLLYVEEAFTFTDVVVTGDATALQSGDFIFSSRGSRGVVVSTTLSSGNTTLRLRQVVGRFVNNDVINNSRDSITFTISSLTDFKFTDVNNIINGLGYVATVTSNTGLKTKGKNSFIKISDLPVATISDYSYTKLARVTLTVQSGAVSITAPNNFTPLTTGYYITSATGDHTATATLTGNTLVLSSISGNPTNGTSVTIWYKLRVNNVSVRTKKNKTFQYLSVTKKKSSTDVVYGNRYDDKEINLRFPDVYKIHAIHEAAVNGVTDTNMFDRLIINDSSEVETGDIIQSGSLRAKIIFKNGVNLHVKYLQNQKFTQGTNLTTQITIVNNPTLVGRFLTEVTHGNYIDITDNYALVKNDVEDNYRISKLSRLGNRSTPSQKITIVFDYFEHGNTTNDFYATSSFNTDDDGDIEYTNIPYAYDGTPYTDILDFRGTYTPTTASGSGTVTAPYVTSNGKSAFDIYEQTKSAAITAYPDEFATYDLSYYTARIDRLYLNKEGKFVISQGSPAINPVIPESVSDSLLINTISIPAYLRDVNQISIQKEDTRRYTMKDIGAIESRVDSIEYYTTLSLLETDTNNMMILDSSGNNRFKNGFLVDNFKSLNFTESKNPDFNMSIDTTQGLMRPYPYVNNIGFKWLETMDGTATKVGGLQKTGDFLSLPYKEEQFASNPYASKVVNLNPFNVFTWVGDFKISPERDVWFDTKRSAPENVPQVDLTGPIKFLYDRSGADGEKWGSWNNTGSERVSGGTEFTDKRTGVENSFSTVTQNIEVGDRIDGIKNIEFARSIVIDAKSSRMKPNTNLYFFIDGEDYNDSVYPKIFRNITRTVNSTSFVVGEKVRIESQSDPGTNQIIAEVVVASKYDSTITANYSGASTVIAIDNVTTVDGTLLNPSSPTDKVKITGLTTGAVAEVDLTSPRISTNDEGTVDFFILVPPEKLETGKSRLVITDESTSTTVEGVSDTNAVANYDSEGTLFELTSLSIDMQIPQITVTPIEETRQRFIPDPPPPPPRNCDPLAQSFFVDAIEGGMFITSIDLYFQSKDTKVPVTIDIRTVENGSPTQTILPFSVKTIEAANVSVNATKANTVTKFTFDAPVYVANGQEYAFILRSRSLNYKVWVSRLNQVDVDTSQLIDKQPYAGSLYKSQNMSVWEPDQFEDIKFNINRAKFTTNSKLTAQLTNGIVPRVDLPTDPLIFTSDSTDITILHPNHCMHTKQNFVNISGVKSDVPNTKLVTPLGNAQFIVDTAITLADGTFTPTQFNNTTVGDNNFGYIKINDEIIAYKSVSGSTITVPSGGRGVGDTVIVSHATNSVVEYYSINGIPLTEINKVHSLKDVISMDKYQISVNSKANETKQSGARYIKASRNLQFESITPRLNEIIFSGTELTTRLGTTSGSSVSEKNTGTFSTLQDVSLANLEVNELDASSVILSPENQTVYFGSTDSFKFYADMKSTVDNLSPMFNLSGSSVITAMNRINRIDKTDGTVDLTSELNSEGSLHDSVYVTKKVTLENSSTSIKILFDAIRRQGVDIKVFAKVKRDDETDDFNLLDYVEIPSTNYPFSPDKETYRAFEYEITGLVGFKEYAIKVVMIGNDQSNVPKIRNFRGIALAV
tara:strand:- start:2806 stop:8949 length:6144 start_codon:yes stop_codon:yes gene_type:complete